MVKKLLFAATFILCQSAFNQEQQYIGGGHSQGVTVSSSSDAKLYDGTYTATGDKTINGAGLEAKQMEVVPLKLRHSRMLGGGFHCVTLDTRRRGTMESYFS